MKKALLFGIPLFAVLFLTGCSDHNERRGHYDEEMKEIRNEVKEVKKDVEEAKEMMKEELKEKNDEIEKLIKDDEAEGGNSLEVNKTLVVKALTQMFDKLNVELVDEYYHEDYIQHTPTIKDGRAGIKEAVSGMAEGGISISREIVRTVAEGDLVYVQSRVSFNDSPNSIVVDIFRVKDGKIIEHWDTMQDEVSASDTASGNGMVDGGGDVNKAVSAEDLAKNKQAVIDFIEKGFVNGDVELLDSLFGDEYIQHNPQVPNGKEAVLGFLADGGFPAKVHQIVAQGDLVATYVEYGNDGDEFHNACADLFRLDDNNKIVEHWDTCMAVPAKDTFMNDNGMF